MFANRIRKYRLLSQAFFKEKEELKKITKADSTGSIAAAYRHSKAPDQDASLFTNLEEYRRSLLSDQTVVTFEVFESSHTSTVARVCERAASPKRWCYLYYYLTRLSKASSVLELGTNLGISGQYFLKALPERPESSFITMEAHPQYCRLAENRFKELSPKVTTRVVQGLYENTFDRLLEEPCSFDLVFIDGNHQKEATLEYFEKLKPCLTDGALVIFDDINWSKDMNSVWEIVKKDQYVALTVDFYKLGLAVVHQEPRSEKPVHTRLFLTF